MVKEIKQAIQRVLGSDASVRVEIPENPGFGHYATNIALQIGREERRPPLDVAKDIAECIRKSDGGKMFERVEAAPPGFINFWLSREALRGAFGKVVKAGVRWGSARERKTVVIDYSHPNIAKPMSVAHLRSTIIGDALYNIFKFRGWKAIGDNHLGDWGKQFGIMIAACKEERERGGKPDFSIEHLLNLYVSYTARMKTEKSLEENARLETKKLQSGDPENVKIWKQMYAVSLRQFKDVYRTLGVKFDYYFGESRYKTMLQGVVEEALRKGVAKRSEGAVIIPFTDKAPLVIQKSDDAFLYSTTDIAAVKFRLKRFKPTLILYVVDNGQSLHFEQLFETVRKLGYIRNERLEHVKFGLVLGEDMKKLSTRAGKHIALQEVIGEAIARARKIVDSKRKDLGKPERLRVAKAVGIAALKYNDLSQNRLSDITFNWDKMLNLEGNSAPYLMYTYARLRSILRKSAAKSAAKAGGLETKADFDLVLRLIRLPEVLERITKDYYPHHLADYLYDLAKAANAFYETEPVLKAEPKLRKARLLLVRAVADVLQGGLKLLGISVPERM